MSHDLNGIWQGDTGGLYYVYHFQNNVWFAGLSDDGQFYNGLRHCSVFVGTMGSDGLITGRWANMPRGTANNGGNLKLKVNYDSEGNATGFTKVPSGDLGSGSFWFNRSELGPAAPNIVDVFDKVKKNIVHTPRHPRGCESLADNLTPYKVYPVVVFGTIPDARPNVNIRKSEVDVNGEYIKQEYKDFISWDDNGGTQDKDGDIDFEIKVDQALLPKEFWTYDPLWIESPLDFYGMFSGTDGKLHCEAIMYGKTAGIDDDSSRYDDPPLLPGWQESAGNGVLINGLPIGGLLNVELDINKDDDEKYSFHVNRINQIDTYNIEGQTLVRVTGILVNDFGHDPNPEIHPLLALDVVKATSQENLTGVWADLYGLTYYIRHAGQEIWWLAMSPPLDNRWAYAFYGTISSDGRQITGTLVNLPLGTNFQGSQGVFNIPPRSHRVLVDQDRLTIELPDGTFLLKLYDRDPGQVDPPPPTPISEAEVLAKLEELAKANPVKLDWKVSIVDLLVLLKLDSSFQTRQKMAVKLGCPAELMKDSAKMNVFLHQAILKELAQNGGSLPQDYWTTQ